MLSSCRSSAALLMQSPNGRFWIEGVEKKEGDKNRLQAIDTFD